MKIRRVMPLIYSDGTELHYSLDERGNIATEPRVIPPPPPRLMVAAGMLRDEYDRRKATGTAPRAGWMDAVRYLEEVSEQL